VQLVKLEAQESGDLRDLRENAVCQELLVHLERQARPESLVSAVWVDLVDSLVNAGLQDLSDPADR